MIDTHAHLDTSPLIENIDQVVERAKNAGIEQILNVGVTLASSKASIELAEKYDEIFAVVGLHPNDNKEPLTPDLKKELESLLSHRKVKAIGEIGLDYHWIDAQDQAAQKNQYETFTYQLDLARQHNLPIVIHSRDAADETFKVLEEAKLPKVVMHCFGYDLSFAENFLRLDPSYMIGFTGIVTFKNAASMQEVATKIPLERIMLETDAPLLAPQKYRGQTNEPAYVAEVARRIAELKGISFEEVDEVTTRNAINFFHLP